MRDKPGKKPRTGCSLTSRRRYGSAEVAGPNAANEEVLFITGPGGGSPEAGWPNHLFLRQDTEGGWNEFRSTANEGLHCNQLSPPAQIGMEDETGFTWGHPLISFPLLPSFPDEATLATNYPDVGECLTGKSWANQVSVAKLIRDLQLGIKWHSDHLISTGCLHSPPIPSNHFPQLGPQFKLSTSLNAVIDQLEWMKKDAIASFEVVRFPHMVRFDEDVNLFQNWPLNKTDTYLSRLGCIYTATSRPLERHVVETADYCTGRHLSYSSREPMFQGPNVLLQRKEMYSLEHGVTIHPRVVSAWAMVHIDLWKQLGQTARTCLDVVVKPVLDSNLEPDVVCNWLSWNKNFGLPWKKAELVFIPCFTGLDYFLLVVNFKQSIIQCIDTVYKSDRSSVDGFAMIIVSYFCKLLHHLKDPRHEVVPDYRYEVFHPKWSTSISDPDSGVSVMHLISHHEDPHSAHISVRLDEEHVRVYKRMTICAHIVISRVNVHRFKVLAQVQHNIDQKNRRNIGPLKEIKQFRGRWK